MKKKNIIGILALTAFLAVSCSDFLNEQPRSSLTPDYFTSDAGIEAGLTAAYSALRYQYGPEGAMSITVVGTDEFTYGGDGSSIEINNYGSALFNNGHLQTPWNRNFTYINTCNGIIEFGAESGSPELIGEAKFLRAQYYYNLVTTFGGVPLDLGSGELKFNTTPSTTSVRNTEEEVYAAMLQDFKDAFENLPYTASRTGAVAKSAALHYIAKTYLAIKDYRMP
ncbi:MAG: RagB/SusD family nutrient uptake outer membrane protein [Bacteroidales bacterium]|nr:RagB/SusD family nutrient uptake outer membrane protein [Bacteroidales bacterium]